MKTTQKQWILNLVKIRQIKISPKAIREDYKTANEQGHSGAIFLTFL